MATGSGKQKERYVVESVVRACSLLSAFSDKQEALRLKDLARRTGLHEATAFRILRTLERCGFLRRVHSRKYQSNVGLVGRSKYRFGYACQGEDPTFRQECTDSILRVAVREGIDLIVLENRYDPETALRNADVLIKERVDLVIEVQFDEHIAAMISARFREAGIPVIAIGTAHPNAVYFGGNNYEAGLIGGRHLGRWAKQNWRGAADQLILVELQQAGPLLHSRLVGVETGVRRVIHLDPARVVHLPTRGDFGSALDALRRHLRRAKARRILVGTVNDPAALGALRALEEAGWEEDCAVVGQGGSPEGRAELRRPRTRLIGTVAFFADKYGDRLIPLGLYILSKKPVPPAIFVDHRLLTPANVDEYYPNDSLTSGAVAPIGNRHKA